MPMVCEDEISSLCRTWSRREGLAMRAWKARIAGCRPAIPRADTHKWGAWAPSRPPRAMLRRPSVISLPGRLPGWNQELRQGANLFRRQPIGARMEVSASRICHLARCACQNGKSFEEAADWCTNGGLRFQDLASGPVCIVAWPRPATSATPCSPAGEIV